MTTRKRVKCLILIVEQCVFVPRTTIWVIFDVILERYHIAPAGLTFWALFKMAILAH
jgi:hypothetical protein